MPWQIRSFPRNDLFFLGCPIPSARCSVPHVELFASTKLPLYVSFAIPDPIVWKQDAFQHPWANLSAYAFFPFALLRQVLSRVMLSTNLSLILVAPRCPQKEWSADLLDLLVEEPLEVILPWNLMVLLHVRKFHRGLETY